jgi:hypothetical protein
MLRYITRAGVIVDMKCGLFILLLVLVQQPHMSQQHLVASPVEGEKDISLI